MRVEVAGFSDVLTLAPGRTASSAIVLRLADAPRDCAASASADRQRPCRQRRAAHVDPAGSRLRRPLRSFKVASNHDFATCTKGGNRRLGRLVNRSSKASPTSRLGSAREIRRGVATWFRRDRTGIP